MNYLNRQQELMFKFSFIKECKQKGLTQEKTFNLLNEQLTAKGWKKVSFSNIKYYWTK
jgi:hypothetical protein